MTEPSNDLFERAFTPIDLGPLTLRNRFIRTGAFEGMSPGGRPTERLAEHHRRVCEGGVAMSTVAYCSVSSDGRTYDTQLLMREEILPGLRKITDAIHGEGALASIQLGHCGDFAERSVIRVTPIGPSRRFNLYGLSFCREMSGDDMERVERDFETAAAMAVDAGFDAVELHAGHGYLLSQFVSPFSNRRADEHGGSLENRLRFPLRALKAVKRGLGGRGALLVKMNADDGFKAGVTLDDAVEAAAAYCEAGADALVVSGGFVSKAPLYMLRGDVPTRDMVEVQDRLFRKIGLALFGRIFVPHTEFEENFFQPPGVRIRARVNKPVVLVGGVVSRSGMTRALEGGLDLFALGRATIHDPDFVDKLRAGEITASDCDHCNRCIAAMDAGGVRCLCMDERDRKKRKGRRDRD